MRFSTRIAGTLLIPAALALAPAAHAAGPSEWRPTVTLNTQDMSTTPKLAFAGDGLPTAFWTQSPGGANPTLRAARPQTDGSWMPEDLVSGLNITSPSVAGSDDGRIYAAWGRETTSGWTVELAVGSTDGTWEIETLATGGRISMVELTRTASGIVTVAWGRQTGEAAWVLESARRVPGGAWQTSQVAQMTNFPYVVLSTATDGSSTVGWLGSADSPTVYNAHVSEQLTPGTWTTTVLAGPNANTMKVATAPDGTPTFVWYRLIEGTLQIESTTRQANGSWPLTVIGPGHAPNVASGPDGRLAVVWSPMQSGSNPVEFATRPLGGSWATSQVTTSGYNNSPNIAIAGDNTTMAIWFRQQGSDAIPEVAELQADGSWATEDLAGIGNSGGGGVTFSPDNTPVATWGRSNSDYSARYAELRARDRSGPVHRELEIPDQGVSGTPVAFSVEAIDAWSPVEETTWDFGDGTSATGASPSHRYAGAGTYTVTVTSRDPLGHKTTSTRTITIADPAPTGPTPLTFAPVPSGSAPTPQPAPPVVTCPVRGVTLVGISATGTERFPRTRLTGVADRSLAGQSITIRRDSSVVGTSTVSADGTVRATVAAPKDLTARNRARYRLVVGTHRSLALKATREASLARETTQQDGAVRVEGRLAVKGKRPTLTVEVSSACRGAAPKRVRTVRTDRRGRFVLTVAPSTTASETLLYRLRQGNRFVTVPIVVAPKG